MMEQINNQQVIWKDRKRFLGMPLSFTKYYVKNNRLYTASGVLSTKEDELLLYRILDFKLEITLWNRIFRVGTITLFTRDETDKEIKLVRIKKPKEIRDMLSSLVEESRGKVKIKGREMYGVSGMDENFEDNYNEE
jgi:uncharacterized membrane protein YdbT with pleckstrin-like domain